METNSDFKKTLLCFYWLMAGADGHISTSDDDPEWRVLQNMKEIESISDKEIEDFLNGDKSENHLYKKLLVNLVIVGHRERIRALAWMYLVMFADGYLHENEEKLFNTVSKHFEVDNEEVNDEKDFLNEIINARKLSTTK